MRSRYLTVDTVFLGKLGGGLQSETDRFGKGHKCAIFARTGDVSFAKGQNEIFPENFWLDVERFPIPVLPT